MRVGGRWGGVDDALVICFVLCVVCNYKCTYSSYTVYVWNMYFICTFVSAYFQQ